MEAARLGEIRKAPATAPSAGAEAERQRLARELHDGPAQSLAAALFGLDLAIAALDRAPATAREELASARALLGDALDDVRALMTGLRPRLLEERGLVAALRALAGVTPLWGPTVVVKAQGMAAGARLPDDVELGLYRITQEAISNARRHGEASRVEVSLTLRSGVLELVVTDDGVGFLPDRVRSAPGRGEGLPGMRERAAALGGALTVTSAPGAGTTIVVRVPQGEAAAAQEGA